MDLENPDLLISLLYTETIQDMHKLGKFKQKFRNKYVVEKVVASFAMKKRNLRFNAFSHLFLLLLFLLLPLLLFLLEQNDHKK